MVKIQDNIVVDNPFVNQDLPLDKVYDEIETRALSSTPDLGYIVINNECNMGCSFCYASKNTVSSKGKFDIEWVKHLMRILPGSSFNHPIITGGEPFLEFELLKQLRPMFPHMTINTNGSLITQEIAQWLIDTDTHVYIALDFKMENFEGHDSEIKAQIGRLITSMPDLKQRVKIAVTFPADRVEELPSLREEQNLDFERDIVHDFNFVCGEQTDVSDEGFIQEVKRIESQEITIQESLFDRQLRYIAKTITDYINVESCGSAIHLNFNGDISLCQVRGSETYRPNYEADVLCKVQDFSSTVYYESVMAQKKKGVCTLETPACPCRWFCANICWANIGLNRHNCEVTKKSLFYALYLIENYSNTDLTQVIHIDTRVKI
jgi:sulfatase maturation enzyme AslB (radical SAM superfamily)